MPNTINIFPFTSYGSDFPPGHNTWVYQGWRYATNRRAVVRIRCEAEDSGSHATISSRVHDTFKIDWKGSLSHWPHTNPETAIYPCGYCMDDEPLGDGGNCERCRNYGYYLILVPIVIANRRIDATLCKIIGSLPSIKYLNDGGDSTTPLYFRFDSGNGEFGEGAVMGMHPPAIEQASLQDVFSQPGNVRWIAESEGFSDESLREELKRGLLLTNRRGGGM